MAEKAAHFSFTTEAKPSIFEVIAQNSLTVTLHPALQKLAEFLSGVSPTYFQWLDRYYDEAFLILNGLLQYYYIKNHDASFAEYFYSLRRSSVKNAHTISDTQKKLSLVFLVIVPYVKRKIEEQLTVFRVQDAEETFSKDLNGRIKKLLLRSHSIFELSWGSWILINYLRYMADETESQLPALYALKVKLVYAVPSEDVTTFWSQLLGGKLNLREMSVGLFRNGLRTSMEIGAFFIQFLQVWNRERSTYNVTALPTVPPPISDPKAEDYRNRCPICLQNWKIPTALPVSGYVFCFPCIVKYLREHQRCPVTDFPAKPLDIVRLYDS